MLPYYYFKVVVYLENNKMQVFSNEEFGSVRTVVVNGEPWFVGKDVAVALGYANTRKALSDHVDEEDKQDGVTIRDSIGREQNAVAVNESGLYSLIMSSKLPNARKFKKWVTGTVLPSIRKTGGYGNTLTQEQSLLLAIIQSDTAEDRALALSAYREVVTAPLRATIEEQKPKVAYCDMVLNSDALTPITVIAKDYGMSAQAMNKKLAELGIQYKKGSSWHLYQEYADCGYVASKTYSNGGMTFTNTEWTQTGRMFIYETLKSAGIIPMLERECA